MPRTIYLVFLILFLLTPLVQAQDSGQDSLMSAKELAQILSDRFRETVKDYEGTIRWTQDDKIQYGTLYFKNPQKMRINFIEPEGQVICTNGYELWLYIKYLNLILHQDILEKEKVKDEEGNTETVVNPILINPVGLEKFLTDYSIEFFETKDPITYKDGSKVYQLKLLRWRSSKNGFNTIFLTVQTNGLIRKVTGITAAYRQIVLEIDDVKINQNLSDLLFNYEPPAHAGTVENFITQQGEQE
jgi:outer membrane lipoprotein-sorting protein